MDRKSPTSDEMEVTAMLLPVEVTFRNMSRSEAIEEAVRERAGRLDRFCDRVMGCRVVVETRP